MSISLGKRLRWAGISFSGTCHESRYEAPFGETGGLFFLLPPCGQVWLMPHAEDGPQRQMASCNFIAVVLFKSFQQVCV